MIIRCDIQGLRGLAVMLVFLYHLYPTIVIGGFIGVDLFFAISGYLVCYSIEKKMKSDKTNLFISFYSARIRRLFPSSLFVVSVLTIYVSIYDLTYFSIYKNDAISSLFMYANYNFYFNKIDYFHVGLKESYLLHYWSLSLEEQFYAIAPLIICLSFNYILILYLNLSLISMLLCIYYGYKDRNKGYFFLTSRSWEFLLGILVRYIPKSNYFVLEYNFSGIMIICLSFYFNDNMIYPSYNAIFPILLCLSVLYSDNHKSILANTLLFEIGNLSYSIYLVHYPFKFIIKESFLSYYLVTFVIIYILHHIVEIPFYRGSFIFSNRNTIICFIISLSFSLVSINIISNKIYLKLKKNKHYSSAELIKEYTKLQRNYCCLNESALIYNSSVLFIGDSHIEQYIIALFISEYKHIFQLIHIYVNSVSYDIVITEKYIKQIYNYYNFSLCVIGNYITSMYMYDSVINASIRIRKICNTILISNDNPYHKVDPNSCLMLNRKECYGNISRTCHIPRKFVSPNRTDIKVVTFWDNKLIYNSKCFYYYNNEPLYSDKNHLSIFYLKTISKKIAKILLQYIQKDNVKKYNKSCPYYHLINTDFLYPNLKNERCNNRK